MKLFEFLNSPVRNAIVLYFIIIFIILNFYPDIINKKEKQLCKLPLLIVSTAVVSYFIFIICFKYYNKT